MADHVSNTATAAPEIAAHEPTIAPNRAKRLYIIIGIAVVVVLVGYALYAMLTAGKESTDDAQVALAQAQGDLETALAQAADADARVSITRATARGALVSAQGAMQSSRE